MRRGPSAVEWGRVLRGHRHQLCPGCRRWHDWAVRAVVPRGPSRPLPALVSQAEVPQGHKRPADAISNAVLVMKIATGEAEESDTRNQVAVALSQLDASKGRKARAARLSP